MEKQKIFEPGRWSPPISGWEKPIEGGGSRERLSDDAPSESTDNRECVGEQTDCFKLFSKG